MRSHQRVNFDQIIRYAPLSIDPAGEHLPREGEGKNLSYTGIYFETKKSPDVISQLKVGNLIWVGFNLPGEETMFKVQCEVRRVLELPHGRVGFGVMFINLSQRIERIINRYITENDRKASKAA